MDVFDIRERLVDDYKSFTTASVDVRDPRIKQHVTEKLDAGEQSPEPWLSLNPMFESGGSVDSLVAEGLLEAECAKIFRPKETVDDLGTKTFTLHRHQRDAVEIARSGKSYVLTTGTGSGKSLAYIIPIVDQVLRSPKKAGVKAIVVYPMNALANSQVRELRKFLTNGYGEGNEPVTYARYTGQESREYRERILKDPPDILLTNYVMLELVLTRPEERRKLLTAAEGLQFLVLDELHTYRGRQGADVSMLVRRVRDACNAPNLQCIGTSATMASGGTSTDQQAEVARVASRIFGSEVTPERVIGETLARATSGLAHSPQELAIAVAAGNPSYGDYDSMASSALPSWIETTFGLKEEPTTGKVIRQRPVKLHDAAAQLSGITDLTVAECEDALRKTLLDGSRTKDPETGRPLFAFRLHQFLSKGDTVHVSIEDEANRYITSDYQVAVPHRPADLLMPLAFCRECGQEYLLVSKRSGAEMSFQPRREREVDGGDTANGYLYVSTDHAWPEDPIREQRFPDDWVVDGKVVENKRKHVPERMYVDTSAVKVDAQHGQLAAYVPSPFRFCLRCGVSYDQVRGTDFAKLATLDAEGRSSAVSVLSTSIVRSLKNLSEDELPADARKLLTFVDNRQDASLQAGHLNDFVQVSQLRGALHRAAALEPEGLTHDTVSARVVNALGLDFSSYASSPEAVYGAKKSAMQAFGNLVEYRLYSDLQRGWRVTMPNLEQTGLLHIEYDSLTQIASDDDLWASATEPIRDTGPKNREDICRVVLDEFRKVLAIETDSLSEEGFERTRRQSDQHLIGLWSIGRHELPVQAGTAFAKPGKAGDSRTDLRLTGRSQLGRYLRAPSRFPSRAGSALNTDEAQHVIEDLLTILEQAGLLTMVVPSDKGGPGYRLKASALIWKAGEGLAAAPDPIRKTIDSEAGGRVNLFFRDLYKSVSAQFTGLHASEHTAQVSSDDRERREERFRTGELPLLFCSPTMELGVDIASLNAVALRNVPPTPANYAQRSGRAGRSGQPAMVVTYCATGNAHDQYYFRRSDQMVSGTVAPPRLDLTNEALLASHIHAVWLAETGADLGSRMTQVLVVEGERPTLEIHESLQKRLSDPDAAERAKKRANQLLDPLRAELENASWWTNNWPADIVTNAAKVFELACDRWRSLYRSALADQSEQNRIVLDTSVGIREKKLANGRRREAESQLELLRNDTSDGQHSDFYTYRYFASEGFLPGYSFPRLPLAAYIPGVKAGGKGDGGSYLQRPRFLAIGEFGPGALIYHEGARYEVRRVQVPMAAEGLGSVDLHEARRCEACGYHHEREAGVDLCENCGAELGASQNSLMRLQTVFTRRRERISSDEEERRRSGFELQTSFRFSRHGARDGRLNAQIVGPTGSTIAEIAYGDTANVRVANLGRRRRKNPNDLGYWLDTVKGNWLTDSQGTDSSPEDGALEDASKVPSKQKVIPFVEDTRNIVVLRLHEGVSESVSTSVRYALERGIEAAFQLEDSELETQDLPDLQHRGRMLLTESAEGGAGVLRRLQAEPGALAIAAREALRIAHFDPDTGKDLDHAEGKTERCEKACYDCLLSFSNQMFHSLIDRHEAFAILMELASAVAQPNVDSEGRAALIDRLLSEAGSSRTRAFVEYLVTHDHALPTAVSKQVPDVQAIPDCMYVTAGNGVAVFLGSVEDAKSGVDMSLIDLGWTVIHLGEPEDWHSQLDHHQSVFGSGKQ